jgi:hypothetical protein
MPNIKGPDGRVISFPEGTSDADIAAAFSQTGDTKSQHPYLDTAKDLAKGVGEGVVNTISGADDWATKHLPAFMTTPIGQKPSPENSARATQYAKDLATPTNTAQKIGKGVEQAAEFFIPGAAEERLLGKAPALARAGGAALSSGVVNKVQGGDFKTGAAVGAAGSLIGAGLKAVAPKIAESAIGIRKTDRAYKAKDAIGRALLDETKGYTPTSVGESAQKALDKLNPELESTIAASPNTVSLAAPRKVVSDAVDTAVKRGARKSYSQLQPVAEHLDRDIFGTSIKSDIPAVDALNLNRGLADDFVGSWNPETLKNVSGTAAKAYHELGEGIKAAVPESRPLYSRISNLIPVENRASGAALNASTTQKLVHRIGAPTGALTGSIFGAKEGYEHGGIGGGIAGGIGGLVLPLLTTTPGGQLALARLLNSQGGAGMVKGASSLGLQLNRPAKKTDDQ